MNDVLRLSVIIPVINEANNLCQLIPFLQKHGGDFLMDLIVVDGGSTDQSVQVARSFGAQVYQSEMPSRALQMNLGAKMARGNTLYFVHADTLPLPSFCEDIQKARLKGFRAGCYRYRFDSRKIMLKINSWATRFNGLFAGGGDQTLFISKRFFEELGGFDPHFCIMEDFDLIRRIKKKSPFYIIPKSITVSARKYDHNTWLQVQLANFLAFLAFRKGVDPMKIKAAYSRRLKVSA
jgi:rSAM/selenodomain-associated transferase 2